MSNFGRPSAARSAVVLLVCAASLLVAQRTYRNMPLPPESPLSFFDPPGANKPSEFYFARLAYTDPYGFLEGERPWQIDSPAAERHFLQGVSRLSNIDARSKEVYVRATDGELFDYPWLYVVEPGRWDLTPEEAAQLREYLLRGGFIMFDDFHGTAQWSIFQAGMSKILPDRPIVELGKEDEVFRVLYDLKPHEQIPGLQMLYTGQTHEYGGRVPHWRGVYDDDGRLMVMINFNMDLGDAWEHADFPEYAERYTAAAYRFGLSYIIYSMTH